MQQPTKMRSRRLWSGMALLQAGLWGCATQDDIEDAELASASMPITATAASTGNPVRTDQTAIEGRYPNVAAYIGSRNCTGTIIGPYAVLSAWHCGQPSQSSNGAFRYYDDTDAMKLKGDSSQISPYLKCPSTPRRAGSTLPTCNNEKQSSRDYRPKWWIDAGGGDNWASGTNNGATDWPAMHDLRVVFAPEVTPELIAEKKLHLAVRRGGSQVGTGHPLYPVQVGPLANNWSSAYEPNRSEAVGVCSSSGDGVACGSRQSGRLQYQPVAQAGDIGTRPRDGYIANDGVTANRVAINGGDSGGPWLRYRRSTGPHDTVLHHAFTIAGTVQNGSGQNTARRSEYAPLDASFGNVTANQVATAERNYLWVRAARDDADGDGLPYACDSDPGDPSGSTNLCPSPLGGPVGSATVDHPRASLECEPGYYVAGYKARAGNLVDRLSLICKPLSCLAGACSHGTYETGGFGGPGGTARTDSCDDGTVAIGLQGRHSAGSQLRHFRLQCGRMQDVKNGSRIVDHTTNAVGNQQAVNSTGQEFYRTCGAGKVLTGFEARSNWGGTATREAARVISGLQPICSDDLTGFTSYKGGGGGTPNALRCPHDYVAVGTTAAARNGEVSYFGMLCAPKDSLDDGAPDEEDLVVIHGSHREDGRTLPAMLRAADGTELVRNTRTAMCPVVSGEQTSVFRVWTYTAGNDILGSWGVHCKTQSGSVVLSQNRVGEFSGGNWHKHECPSDQRADGMFIKSGWSMDGLSVHCSDL